LGNDTFSTDMKIAFINDGIYTYALGAANTVGGAERQQWLLACALVARGWQVTVAVRGLLQAGERRTINGVDFVSISQGQFFLAYARFLAAERPHWVYWRGAEPILGPCTMIARSFGVRTVFSTAFDSEVHPRRALFRRQRWWPLYALGLSLSDIILVQHGQQLAGLKSSLQTKALILRSMVSQVATMNPHCEREPYVVWAAVLRQPKRPDVLIDIAQRAPAVRFVVCGGTTTYQCPPGYGERIVTELRGIPNVEYRGQVTPGESLHLIANASLLLSTSDEEGFPNTFLEAWSRGTPVVSVNIDPDRIIQQTNLGAVTKTVDQTLADIHMLLDSPQHRDEIAARAHRYVTDNHSEEAVLTAFDQALAWAASRKNLSSVES
jgi:glycosyltransferase involved in cell wall biosynthesis